MPSSPPPLPSSDLGEADLKGSPQPQASGSTRNIVVSLLLSALVLAAVGALTFDATAFGRLLQHLRPGLLLAAVLVAFARIGLGGWRLSQVSEGRLSLWSGTRGQLAWDFFSSVTPSVVGGGPVAAFYVARDEDLAVGTSAAFLFFCVLLDQLWFLVAIPLLGLSTFAIDLLPSAAGAVGMWSLLAYFGGLLLWSALYAYATLVRPRLLVAMADWCVRWPYLRRFRETVMPEMRSYFRRARHLGSRPPAFYAYGFSLTALIWTARYALVFFIVRSVHAADGTLLFARSAAMMLVGLIMPTPGGSGGLEGLYALFIGPLMPEALLAPTLLTWRLLGYYLFIALGAHLFLHQLHQRRAAGSTAPE